jgi:hypothetical protein
MHSLPPQVCHVLNLDYDSLCQPWRCEQTLTCEKYTHGGPRWTQKREGQRRQGLHLRKECTASCYGQPGRLGQLPPWGPSF